MFLDQLFTQHFRRFHSVAPRSLLQRFSIPWPPLSALPYYLPYYLSDSRTALLEELSLKLHIRTHTTASSSVWRSPQHLLLFLHIFFLFSLSSTLWLRNREEAQRAEFSILGEKAQIDRPDSSGWLYGFLVRRWARGSCSHVRPATRRLNTK